MPVLAFFPEWGILIVLGTLAVGAAPAVQVVAPHGQAYFHSTDGKNYAGLLSQAQLLNDSSFEVWLRRTGAAAEGENQIARMAISERGPGNFLFLDMNGVLGGGSIDAVDVDYRNREETTRGQYTDASPLLPGEWNQVVLTFRDATGPGLGLDPVQDPPVTRSRLLLEIDADNDGTPADGRDYTLPALSEGVFMAVGGESGLGYLSLFTTCRLLLTVHYLLFTTYCLLLTVHYLLFLNTPHSPAPCP